MRYRNFSFEMKYMFIKPDIMGHENLIVKILKYLYPLYPMG